MGETERRRRRLRQPSRPPAAVEPSSVEPFPAEPAALEPSAATAGVHDPETEERPRPPRRGREPGRAGNGGADDREAERGLRGLVGSGASQVSPAAAMRARDASRPSADDEAEAEAKLVVVRRNWVPRDELPRGGR
jgi:hypothetical protein